MTISASKVAAREAARRNNGEFGEQHLAEPGGLVDHTGSHWGSVHVSVGARTPWGQADHVSNYAPGIVAVGTPGHGGLKLSPERNRAIPAPLRNRSGWYEEDVEAFIVTAVHGLDGAPHWKVTDEDAREQSWAAVRDWMPDAYEAATGLPATESNSMTRRREADDRAAEQFRAEHANDFVSTGWGKDANGSWVPEGYRVLSAKVDSTGEVRDFLVPARDCISDHSLRPNVLIDPSRHVDVTDVTALETPNPNGPTRKFPTLHGDELGVSTRKLTPTARQRAEAELGHTYRWPDGQARTFAEELGRVGVVSKTTNVSHDGKTRHWVELPDGTVYSIGKAAYDALDGVPEGMSDAERARNTFRTLHRRRQVKAGRGLAPSAAENAAYEAAERAFEALEQQERADTLAAHAATQRMRRDAVTELLRSRGELG